MVVLNPLTMEVAKIITVMLNAIAAMAIFMMILEKDFLELTPTLDAIKKEKFKLKNYLWFDSVKLLIFSESLNF